MLRTTSNVLQRIVQQQQVYIFQNINMDISRKSFDHPIMIDHKRLQGLRMRPQEATQPSMNIEHPRVKSVPTIISHQ